MGRSFFMGTLMLVALFAVKSHANVPSTRNGNPKSHPFVNASKRGLKAPSFGLAGSIALDMRGGEVLEPNTLDEIESIILAASASKKLVIIDFSATWCGPCKVIAPLYHELSDMDENENVVFLKVDVDDNSDAAMKWSVSSMPTFLFIKSGEVVERLSGANPARLQEMLSELR